MNAHLLDLFTSFLVTSKEGLEACLISFAILKTVDDVGRRVALKVGIITGVLLSGLLLSSAQIAIRQIEAVMPMLTIVTVLVLIYLASNKHNKTGWRTKMLLKMSESRSIPLMFIVGAIVTFREGLEVIGATVGLYVVKPFVIASGIIAGIVFITVLGIFASKYLGAINKAKLYVICNGIFILMAVYYLYEVLS